MKTVVIVIGFVALTTTHFLVAMDGAGPHAMRKRAITCPDLHISPPDEGSYAPSSERYIMRSTSGVPLFSYKRVETSDGTILVPIILFDKSDKIDPEFISQDEPVSFEQISEANICILTINPRNPTRENRHKFLIINMLTGSRTGWYPYELLGVFINYSRLLCRAHKHEHDELVIMDVMGARTVCPIHVGDSEFVGIREFMASDGQIHPCATFCNTGAGQQLSFFDIITGASITPR